MVLPSKKLLHISLPSEEGGDMITMERFVSLMEQQLPVWADLMVGDRHINIALDGARPVHFFLLDDFPWYVHISPIVKALFVKSPGGKTYQVRRWNGFTTVLDVMMELVTKEGVSLEDIWMVHDGKYLEKSRYIRDYKRIKNESTIHMMSRLRGGGSGVPFADVTDRAGPQKSKWSDSAPDWRHARKGLFIEGKCSNKHCRAYGHMVIMNKGFTEFDLINDGHTCQCPVCKEPVVPVTCGFNNCQWKVIGRKIEKLGQPPKMFKTEWKSAGDAYERFSPNINGSAHFLDLKILCEVGQRMLCVVCAESIERDEKVAIAECRHTFHSDRCFDVATSVDRNCIRCMARQSMTNYQKLFG